MSQRIAVMYLGAIVEVAPTAELIAHPWHPYTEALLAAVPKPDPEALLSVEPLGGEPPSASRIPSGCRFRTRCPLAESRCEREETPGHFVACHFRPS
jgi:oligopeptide/dipeptide ABC transporter ATP-binding protein